jgi:hypothetical protein
MKIKLGKHPDRCRNNFIREDGEISQHGNRDCSNSTRSANQVGRHQTAKHKVLTSFIFIGKLLCHNYKFRASFK